MSSVAAPSWEMYYYQAIQSPTMGEYSLPNAQRKFWQGLKDKLSQRPETPLSIDSTYIEEPQSYVPQKQGLSPDSVHYVLVTNTVEEYIGVKLQIEDTGHELFTYLHDHRTEIESQISPDLEWATGQAWDKVVLKRDGTIKTDRDNWDAYQDWLIEYGETFAEVFDSYLNDVSE